VAVVGALVWAADFHWLDHHAVWAKETRVTLARKVCFQALSATWGVASLRACSVLALLANPAHLAHARAISAMPVGGAQVVRAAFVVAILAPPTRRTRALPRLAITLSVVRAIVWASKLRAVCSVPLGSALARERQLAYSVVRAIVWAPLDGTIVPVVTIVTLTRAVVSVADTMVGAGVGAPRLCAVWPRLGLVRTHTVAINASLCGVAVLRTFQVRAIASRVRVHADAVALIIA
jgi:hypothetical protein